MPQEPQALETGWRKATAKLNSITAAVSSAIQPVRLAAMPSFKFISAHVPRHSS